ncbi:MULTISPECIES: hypothetical protein [Cupriavidus]|jgi:hypothetical protein|nr:hypothetical protein [Cupriavidus pauculus]
MTAMTTRERWLRGIGLVALGAVLAAGFLAYLRPAFMVDLTNMVLAWCG